MFAPPQTKRVRREDLHSPTSSREASPNSDLEAAFFQNFQPTFDLAETTPQTSTQEKAKDNNPNDDNDDGEAAYEFNLFRPTTQPPPTTTQSSKPTGNITNPAPTTNTALQPQPTQKRRIRLDSPAPSHLPLHNTKRPESYYFAPPASSLQKASYAFAAMSGQEVLARAERDVWYGMRHPWRVVVWPHPPPPPPSCASRKSVGMETLGSSEAVDARGEGKDTIWTAGKEKDGEARKRTRLGKKGRIKRRVKMEGVRRAKEARVREKEGKVKEAEEKERHLREKKARVNRAKQIKKREREREKRRVEEGGGAGGERMEKDKGNVDVDMEDDGDGDGKESS